ncbi:MAG: orotate phosphoribosyltransferase [Phycisphaerae bacterium]|nr:orotate phosphoribosyltransferase [Phycisphaerae bacterium]NUQ46407.1 orotate phosphoribosyltransferase [Phycisphaerae bacterium]
MDLNELARRIRQTAYLRGEFTLRSGRKSNVYLDKYLFETQPDVLAAVGRLMAAHLSPRTTRIAGAELGGVPLAAATSLASGRPFVIVRNRKKDYGTAKPFEGALTAGDVVLLVEDVATTGGQVLEAAAALKDAGAVIEKIVAVIDRQEGARQNIESAGYAFAALLTMADIEAAGES